MRKILFWIFVVNEKDNKKDDSVDLIFRKKCNFCDRCEECECEYTKEKNKKDEQKELELDLSAINYFVFIFLFLFIFICNLTLWLKIAY
jgi:hypothetical protein